MRGRPRKRPSPLRNSSSGPGPMQLWGIDIVSGIHLGDERTGQMQDDKLVIGVTTIPGSA